MLFISQSAHPLTRFAKDENNKELKDEIRFSGGLHSLLTLIRSSGLDQELKTVTAMSVAYIVHSYNPVALLKTSFVFVDCLCYLINPRYTSSSLCEDLSLEEIRETEELDFTRLWFYVLQPKLASIDLDCASP